MEIDLLEKQAIVFAQGGAVIFKRPGPSGLLEEADNLGILLGLNANFPIADAQLARFFLSTLKADRHGRGCQAAFGRE